MKYIITLSIVILCSLSAKESNSQIRFVNEWSLTLHGSAVTFYGDISDKEYFFLNNGSFPDGYSYSPGKGNNNPFATQNLQHRKPAFGLTLDKYIYPCIAVGAGFFKGSLYDQRQSFGMEIKTDYWESIFFISLNITRIIYPHDPERRFSWFVYSGIGLTNFIAQRYDIETGEILAHKGSEHWGRASEGVVPVGVGAAFKITRSLFFNAMGSLRGMNTDLLDAYESNISGIEGYGYVTIGIQYKFNLVSEVLAPLHVPYKPKSNEPALKKYNTKKRSSVNKNDINKRPQKSKFKKYAPNKR
ncbi:MAG: hypothetical protein RQ866_07435 [Bacteroidales bacterium]|nr:hypothetical protein [Bacteroidales bacterium]